MSIKVPDLLAADCNACESLCCVAVSRKEVDGYKSNCESGEACANLDITWLQTGCRVYGILDQLGWEACHKFDCYGAGPVVKSAFDRLGISWRKANQVDRESLFAFFRLTRFVFNRLARAPNQYRALVSNQQVEQGLDRAFKSLLLNPLNDDEQMFEVFLIECPQFLLLPDMNEDVSSSQMIAAE